MSRVLKRPMFKLGGSTSAGITSGLSRRGYKEAGPVDWGEVDVIANQMKDRYGPVPRQGYNVWDFLTEWGLNMASSPPMGNVIQTAAGTAKEPYGKMVEGKGKDEMAQYMANMASTDKALAAFTDIKVAQTEAEANRELKNLPFKRQALENAHKIQATKRQGEFGYDIQEALGISTGNLFIAEMMDEKGGSVNAGQIKRTYKEDGSGIAPIDFGAYDMDKIWWDPKKLQWLTIQIQEKDGVKSPEGIYHGSKEQAYAALGSTVKTGADTTGKTGDDTTGEPKDKSKIITESGTIINIVEGDWNHGKTKSGNLVRNGKIYDKDNKRLLKLNSLNYLGNSKWGFGGYEIRPDYEPAPFGEYRLESERIKDDQDKYIYLDEVEQLPPEAIKGEELVDNQRKELEKWWEAEEYKYDPTWNYGKNNNWQLTN